MARRNFAEILKGAKIDLAREYARLFNLFYESKDDFNNTLNFTCENAFLDMNFRGTCVSLDDFNEVHGFNFVEQPNDFDLDYLVDFCEYTYNLCVYIQGSWSDGIRQLYVEQMYKVIELINCEFIYDKEENVYILIPKNQESIAVAEIVDEKIAYMTLEYNHHSMKGDLHRKKTTLKYMADDIEPQRKQLKSINTTLESQLFQMFQKFVRHNNEENPYIKSLSKEELESIYDDIYQMWLLAKLEIDNIERKKRVVEILNKANEKAE